NRSPEAPSSRRCSAGTAVPRCWDAWRSVRPSASRRTRSTSAADSLGRAPIRPSTCLARSFARSDDAEGLSRNRLKKSSTVSGLDSLPLNARVRNSDSRSRLPSSSSPSASDSVSSNHRFRSSGTGGLQAWPDSGERTAVPLVKRVPLDRHLVRQRLDGLPFDVEQLEKLAVCIAKRLKASPDCLRDWCGCAYIDVAFTKLSMPFGQLVEAVLRFVFAMPLGDLILQYRVSESTESLA